MNLEFIRKAENAKPFHLSQKDFQSLEYKQEIQHLFNKHFFEKLDIHEIPNDINIDSINKLIVKLKKFNKSEFEKLHKYNVKDFGPGEVTLYFLCNNSKLGGKTSPIDITVNSSKYEVKAVRLSSKGIISDFKLGGTVPLYSIQKKLNTLRIELNLPGSAASIPGSIIDKMRDMAPEKFQEIEHEFSKIAYDHFMGVDVIFINNTTTSPKYGEIIDICSIGKHDMLIERMTNGTIKPKMQL